MTKSKDFKPIVLEQKTMKRVLSNCSLTTQDHSEENKLDKNRKIPQKVKNYFIEMVTQKNFSMKNAAKLAGISYSTAKKIFTNFRITLKNNITKRSTEHELNTNAPRALFRDVTLLQARRVTICCLIGGISQQA